MYNLSFKILGFLWSILGLVLHYWTDKYKLLNMSKQPFELGPQFSLEMIENIEYALPIYQIGNFVFLISLDIFDWHSAKWGIFALLISILNAILPMEDINKWLESSDIDPSDKTLYIA
jgi:hypothetical protein